MSTRVHGLLRAVRRSIEVRGGGVRGFAAVATRAWRMLRALGPRGVIARIHAAGRVPPPPVRPETDHVFPAPLPVAADTFRVGIMVHMFYPDLADEFAAALSRMPVPFVLLVSVTDADAEQAVHAAFAQIDGVTRLEIVQVPNRGRDIAPLLVTFREQILGLDIIGHLHSKKSLYTGRTQDQWRTYLLDALLGSRERIAWHLGMFAAEPKLGLVYPESHESIPLWGHTWLSNVTAAATISQQLGVAIDPHGYIDMPAGSMFWARSAALQPLFALRLPLEAFPEESGQLDGTLQHAIERLFVGVVRAAGYLSAVLPRDHTPALSLEGERNWQTYFLEPLIERIAATAVDARLISVDVFDTLVQRPFLTPEGARRYLARVVELSLGLADFVDLRARAESRARVHLQRDPKLDEIYAEMAQLVPDIQPDRLREIEIETERRLLRPRHGLLEALAAIPRRGRRMVALSDMYLPADTLRNVLPGLVVEHMSDWYVSCETGARKDAGDAWPVLAENEHVPLSACLHIGDNEHADVQQPHWQGMITPVHVLRAAALLDVVPALRPLRAGIGAAWPDQLALGLVANHFSALADATPDVFLGPLQITPKTFGYVVLGPLVLDFLTWLAREAREQGVDRLLFLSREGYLLAQAFERLRAAHPAWSDVLGHYLLASRQATGLAALRNAEDMRTALDGSFNGSLAELVSARLGAAAASAVAAIIGSEGMDQAIFLPEMRDTVAARLAPATDALLALARSARDAYQAYWNDTVGEHRALVVDLGYAGTIQRNLSRLLDRSVDGAYFALDHRAQERLSGTGRAQARYHDARTDTGPSAILAHDLLLESVLTAPHAQFAGFDTQGGMHRPVYAAQGPDAAQWSVIETVHTAALAFIDDALSAAGPLAAELAFDARAAQIPLECVGRGRWSAPWLAGIGVDDAFSGRGRVPAAAGPARPV
ncbi:polysaccharide biosynthesis protein [Luteimonas sp. SJ-16]|uniref:Polysaccharide biosynthesis protein n=2 Tax=Luteimonas deserti TaxID=2752306 RepID=A0A7Z0QPF7_9GAMM|nr:polysaccharide biosynthesis protein [Luteimonas deserti]